MKEKVVSNEQIQHMLDEIMKEIAVLVTEIRSLAVEVGNYVHSSKELYEKGNEAVSSVLELKKALPEVKAEIRKAARRLKERMPIHCILRAKMTHPEIVEIMKSLAKRKSVLDDKKSELIRGILSGKIDGTKLTIMKLRGELHD